MLIDTATKTIITASSIFVIVTIIIGFSPKNTPESIKSIIVIIWLLSIFIMLSTFIYMVFYYIWCI
jgi:hypothetical protein